MAVKKKKGLGRGLDALISPLPQNRQESSDNNINITSENVENDSITNSDETDNSKSKDKNTKIEKEQTDNGKVVEKIVETKAETMIKIDEIEPNREQPRQIFDEESLQELADSIRTHGIIQPLIVQKDNDYYKIIAGERRWRAARLAGLTEVPVLIKDYSPMEAVEIALVENLQREDLNPIEEANAYQKLIEEFGLKQEEAAEKVSKSRTAVTNSLRLLKLDDRVKQMIIDEMISSGHGRCLLALSDKDLQYNTAMKIFDNKLSVRETERLVKNMLTDKPATKKKDDPQMEAIYHELENKMKSIIGTKVSINTKNNKKGKIEIEYYSEEDLERIIALFETINN